MEQVVGIRFNNNNKIYNFATEDIPLEVGEGVIVDTARGLEFGYVTIAPYEVLQEELEYPLKPVVRKATPEDELINNDNLVRAEEAHIICKEKIKEHGLDMKLLETEYNFDNSKLMFHFASEKRVDFRDLVRDLASIFRTRIELRQVGVRDEAKYIGAMGSCGRETCCSSFLCEFRPVTINMAKDQSFSLNPAKISGMCGRLMCCLAYEQETYQEMIKKMPDIGSKIKTPDGVGVVTQVSPLQELIRVRVHGDGGYEEENYDLKELDTTR